MSKKNDKQPAEATDSAVATAMLFAPAKVAATIAKVQWSGRDNPCWALPRPGKQDGPAGE